MGSPMETIEINVQVDINEMTNNGYWSEDYSIHGLPWKLELRENSYTNEKWLSALLFCKKKEHISEQVYAARAIFKLLPFNTEGNSVEYKVDISNIFDSTIGFGPTLFVPIAKLNSFIQSGKIRLIISINPIDIQSKLYLEPLNENCIDCGKKSFKLTVTNINNLIAVRSQIFDIHGLNWHFTVLKTNNCDTIRVVLFLKTTSGLKPCKMEMFLKINSSEFKEEKIFEQASPFLEKNIPFEDLMTKNNQLTMEVRLQCLLNIKIKDCPVCYDSLCDKRNLTLKCEHMFCGECIYNLIDSCVKNRRTICCPCCREPIVYTDLRPIFMST